MKRRPFTPPAVRVNSVLSGVFHDWAEAVAWAHKQAGPIGCRLRVEWSPLVRRWFVRPVGPLFAPERIVAETHPGAGPIILAGTRQ